MYSFYILFTYTARVLSALGEDVNNVMRLRFGTNNVMTLLYFTLLYFIRPFPGIIT